MIHIDITVNRPVALPVPAVLWLAMAIVAVAVLAMLQGQVSVVHELVHDARHFIGVPCH